jgi:predicted transcriptional regulator
MAMTVRLDPETDALLTKLAEQTGMSKQAVIADAIRSFDAGATRTRDLESALEFVLSHDAKLMQRLADA